MFKKQICLVFEMKVSYDDQASKWNRNEPKHHSDFCGRPEVLEIVRNFCRDRKILDIACGDGYFSRKMSDLGNHVSGFDLFKEMVRYGLEREETEKRGIEYFVGNAIKMPIHRNSKFDLCAGNYITNELTLEELEVFYQELSSVLNKDGSFVLLMPHPVFQFVEDYGEAIKYEIKSYDYIESRGKLFKGFLKTVQGDTLVVNSYHSTFEDHLNSIASAGLKVDNIKNLVFPEEIAKNYPVFRKISGKVSGMIIIGSKTVS